MNSLVVFGKVLHTGQLDSWHRPALARKASEELLPLQPAMDGWDDNDLPAWRADLESLRSVVAVFGAAQLATQPAPRLRESNFPAFLKFF